MAPKTNQNQSLASSQPSPQTSTQDARSQQAPSDYIARLRQIYCQWPTSSFYLQQLERYLCLNTRSTLRDCAFQLSFQGTTTPPKRAPVSNESSSSKLIVVEGHPSPECLSGLGNLFSPPPELFLGHLDYERVVMDDRTSYETPALPSRRTNIIQIRFITLGRLYDVQSRNIVDEGTRKNANEECLSYEKRLFDDHKYGASRFRRVNWHNSRYFSVEQMASFSIVCQNHEAWTGLLMLDQGPDVIDATNLPFTRSAGFSTKAEFLPIVRYNEAISSGEWDRQDVEESGTDQYHLYPYHPLADKLSSHQQSLVASDPHYLLCRIYSAVALSWGMIFNFLDDVITSLQNSAPERARQTLAEVRYNLSIIQRFRNEIAVNKHVIEWMISISQSNSHYENERSHNNSHYANKREVQKSLEELLANYNYLLEKCADLSQRCDASTVLLQGSIGILEAEKSILQSTEINRLTRIALIFIPLSFCASVFGMNVHEVLNKTPSIWVFFVVAIIVTSVTFFGLPAYRFACSKLDFRRYI